MQALHAHIQESKPPNPPPAEHELQDAAHAAGCAASSVQFRFVVNWTKLTNLALRPAAHPYRLEWEAARQFYIMPPGTWRPRSPKPFVPGQHQLRPNRSPCVEISPD